MKNSISLFLAISLFLFGVLKFVNPFKTWYQVQVLKSGLGETSYWLGIAGEIFIGILILLTLYFRKRLSKNQFSFSIIVASLAIIVMMMTASYVHLQPDVPASVLPLKIKSPIIPVAFLLLATFNIYTTLKKQKI